MPKFLGIDPGTRGGAGLCVVQFPSIPFSPDDKPTVTTQPEVVEAITIQRNPQLSTIQMILAVRDAVVEMNRKHNLDGVGREDHNFIGHVERMSRNILRKMNGALDVTCCDLGFTPGLDYHAFAPGSWKVIAGLPGDLGKEIKAQVQGQRFSRGQKKDKSSPAVYLATANDALGYPHTTTDAADAHGIAKAVATLWALTGGVLDFWKMPSNIKDVLWDRDRALGRTRAAVEKAIEQRINVADQSAGKFLRSFSP